MVIVGLAVCSMIMKAKVSALASSLGVLKPAGPAKEIFSAAKIMYALEAEIECNHGRSID